MQNIPKAVFAYIEWEMYQYRYRKEQMDAYKEEIYESNTYACIKEKVDNKGYTSDPTAKKAIEITVHKELNYCKDWIKTIKKTLSKLTPQHRKLFEHKYMQDKHWREVLKIMGIDRETSERLQEDIVAAIAIERGMIIV